MDDEVVERYREAGRIASDALTYGAELIEEGTTFLEVAEGVESRVRDLGGEPAFPCNLSRNEDAAHYSPGPGDETVFERGDVVKIDVGVHVDGYIGDNALTVEVGTNQRKDLVEASREGLRAAIDVVEAGVPVEDVGRAVENAIRSYGFRPIVNLTGHSVDRFHQHAGLSIPNVARGSGTIEAGTAIAIEPFATDGSGRVKDSDGGNIYLLEDEKPQRMSHAKRLMAYVVEHHDRLPFASRWLEGVVPENKLPFALRMLERTGALHHYPVLREERGGWVSQHERTMLVLEDRVEVTTNW